MTVFLYVFNIAIYLAFTIGTFAAPQLASFCHSLAASSGQLASAPYTLLSYAFLHESFGHLFANLATLFIFTRVLGRLSAATWAAVYFAGAIASALGYFAVQSSAFASASGTALMGASGAISALAGFAALLLRQPQLVAVLVLINLLSSAFVSGVAFSAHIFGLLYGAICGLIWQRFRLRL